MLTLRQFDRTIARILKVAQEKAPRPYEFLLLSDHGQSAGATFKQRYGISIVDFIQQQLPQDVNAVGTGGGDDGTIGVAAMMAELENIENNQMSGRIGRAAIRSTQRAMKHNLDQQPGSQPLESAKVTLCYSGNLAQVYFDLYPRRITLNELNTAYPGMVDALVQHEGIGFVVAYQEDGDPVAFSKNGARNLHIGDVLGEDPLLPYGDVALRSWQVCRIADFPNAGDLILNSTIYPDGTVAALEELIGNHGGLGGEQTDAFLFHPGDMDVPQTRNSYEFKSILDSRRGLPGPTPKPERPAIPYIDPWSFKTLAKGIGQVGTWLRLALQSIGLSTDAYIEIARNAYMTGPALLISLLAQVVQSYVANTGWVLGDIILRCLFWFLTVLFMFMAARLLRGRSNYTATLRVVGFVSSVYFFELFSLLPVIGPTVLFLTRIVVFIAVWTSVSTAHEIRGWRTLLLPVVYILSIFISLFFLFNVIRGTGITIQNLLIDFGLTPK